MEIEKLIKHMREEAQDYRSGRTLGRAFADAEDVLDEAATALEQLQAESDRLRRERDAAVGDLETIMAYGGGNLDTCQFCKNSQCYARGGTKLCLPEWRG